MGCRHTKDSAPDEKGSREFEDLNEVKTTPVKDSRQPLDTRQLFKLKQSWKGIKRKMEETGIEMFIRLFKNNASVITLFTKFNGIENEDDMRNNEALEYHATFVMSTLDDAISNFDNFDLCIQTLHRIGNYHKRFDGFNKDYFMLIKAHFLDAVRTTLEDRYTPYMENIYEVAISFIIKSLTEGYTRPSAEETETPDTGNDNTMTVTLVENTVVSETDGKEVDTTGSLKNIENDIADKAHVTNNIAGDETHTGESQIPNKRNNGESNNIQHNCENVLNNENNLNGKNNGNENSR